MAIREKINKDGSKIYTAYVDGTDARGVRIQKKRRGLTSKRLAEAAEFELKRQIANLKDQKPQYNWEEWFKICLERMRIEFKQSTLLDYECKNRIWIEPFLKGKLLKDISSRDIYDVVYNSNFDVASWTRRGPHKIVRRILQIAIEDGMISCNPAVKIKVKINEARKSVLNRVEVEKFLLEAKKCNHRFYEI